MRRHLTYCTNVHPGERWADVRDGLRRWVVPVRERFAPGEPFGVGLRLSALAARELAAPGELAALRDLLDEHGLYLFTINGFPYGAFHGERVKEHVYRPDWRDPARLAYTNQLADHLAALLPDDVAEGTISTVPGGFAPWIATPDDAARVAAGIAAHAAHLHRLRETTGRRVALAIEPEPCCFLETIAQTVAFFETHLHAAPAVDVVRRATGLARPAAEAVLREHVGVCLDACHLAVEFEEPAAVLAALDGAGIRAPKVQVSAGLEVAVRPDEPETLAALRAFADDVYLHQVVERLADGRLVRYLDLPEALAAAERTGAGPRTWRVHFHVPLFLERLGHFASTQGYVRELLALVRGRDDCRHLEVETYTWDVLPARFRRDDLVTALVRELRWTADRLRDAPPGAAPDHTPN